MKGIVKKMLPYAFSITGLGLACNIGSPLSFYSGIFLLLFACLIWMKQLANRQDQASDTVTRHA